MPAINIEFEATVALSVGSSNDVGADVLHERLLPAVVQSLPPGRAWAVVDAPVWSLLARGLARCFGRLDVFERVFVRQFDPATATYGLNDWERVLELSPDGKTIAERRAAILAKLRARGGQSIDYWTAFLETLGYQNVSVTPLENRFRCGDKIRKRIQGNAWAYALQITATSIPSQDTQMQAQVRAAMRGTVYLHFNLL